MKIFPGLCALAAAAFLAGPSLAQSIEGCLPFTLDDVAAFDPPAFAAYPAEILPIAKPAAPDLASHPEAKTFRTQLRDGAKDGPNFAGHYTIVGWGCGSACLDFGILDAKNGHVYFPPEIRAVRVMNAGTAANEPAPAYDALRFRPDSDLLILLGALHEDESKDGIAYYRWDGKELLPVKTYRSAKTECE
ncbi:hypothetical protein FRZ61_11140 [Hypericibacter adhaerens]|uniref:Lipoprotein n=1 Tax=Hypericibacter adhaerens TaxID=2602016 RepID=A0A5J6MU01_9PROT|nr:hypothetical protein [Hypericibacter adhaerens]QEX21192.1 hypothetical protein FRZ61_11140 [Hypericibacter adhaerens]